MAQVSDDLASALPEPALRRNYLLGVLNGATFRLSLTLLDGSIVLPWFVSQITASRVVIGLLLPIQNGGWFLPQLFLSRYVQRQRRRVPLYNVACAIRWLFWLLLAGSVFVLGPRRLPAVLAAVLLAYTGFSFVGSATGIAFTDLVAQGIGARQRGTFFAWRNLTGGVLAVAGSVVVARLIGPGASIAFPYNFGVLAVLSLGVLTVMFFSLSCWVEVDHPPPPPESNGLSESVLTILRRDRTLRGFLLTRVLLIGASVTTPFFVVQAGELGSPQRLAGLFLIVYTASELASNLLWGWISDHVSNKLVLGLTGVLALAQNLLALAFRPGWPAPLYLLVFVLMGLIMSGGNVCSLTLLLEIADPRERPVYVGLANTALGVATLLLPLGGVLAEVGGLRPLLGLAAGLAAAGLASLAAWRDPRAPGQARPRPSTRRAEFAPSKEA